MEQPLTLAAFRERHSIALSPSQLRRLCESGVIPSTAASKFCRAWAITDTTAALAAIHARPLVGNPGKGNNDGKKS